MSWRQHGRARVDPNSPRAFAVCDRCGFWYNHIDLNWQFQWAGPTLINIRQLVCDTCLDIPQEQLRSIILPPDPDPVMNARPENFVVDEVNYRATQDGDRRVTEEDSPRVTEGGGNKSPTDEDGPTNNVGAESS